MRRIQSAWRNIQFIDDKDGVQFRVVIRRASEGSGKGSFEPNEPNSEPNMILNEPNEPNTISLGAISKDGCRLLEMIERESSLTILQMAAMLNVSRETVKRLLKKLKEIGLLVREGGTRGHWRVRRRTGF